MKYYFIINPNSGKIDTNQFEQRILKECSKEKIKYKIFYTHNAGDAKKFAKKIPDEECVVFSVGGDGNLNAVLNGLAGSKNKILGNIPTGSGNDFERTLNQYDDGIHDFDFGIINGRHFINVACVGLDADVANNISWIRKKKWIPVSQRYNASILYTFIKFHKVDIDKNIFIGQTFIICGVVKFFLDYLRSGHVGFFLSTNQIFSITFILAGLILVIKSKMFCYNL